MAQFSCGRVILVPFLILFYVTENQSTSYEKFNYLKYDNDRVFDRVLTSITNVKEERMKALNKYLWTVLAKSNVASEILRHASESNKDLLVAIVMLKDYKAQANDGLLYGDDFNLNIPRKPSVDDVFNLMNGNYNFDFDDGEEAKKYKLQSIIEKLNKVVMNKYLDISKDDIGMLVKSTSSSEIPTVDSRNSASEIDLYKYVVQNHVKEINDVKEVLHMFHSDAKIKTKAALRFWEKFSKKAKKKCRKACEGAYKDICKDYKCSKGMKKYFEKNCKSECNSQFDD